MVQDLTTRPASPADEPLLVEATLGNLNWGAERFVEPDVRRRPEFRLYTLLLPERGDFGFVGERAGRAIGVAWAQFLPADDPGYGFVDEATPEVSLWVRGGSRGQGVGGFLLARLQQEATERGVVRLSLSVESDNHAKQLYVARGFTEVSERQEDGVMIWVC